MDWLTELLRGSSPSGQYHGKHPDESIWDEARNSVDELTDIEREEIDCAIALSLSEEDYKGKKLIIDEPKSEEDEHLTIVLFEEDEPELEEDEHLTIGLFEEDEPELEEDEHLTIGLFEEDEPELEEDEHLTIGLFEEDEPELEEDEYLMKALFEEDEPESEEDEQLMKALFEEDEHLMKALFEEDENLMKALSEEDEHLPKDRSEEDEHLAKAQLEEDEQLAKALQESMSVESPPRIFASCNTEIGHERYLSFMGGVWHPQCFSCHACKQPITDYEFSRSGNRPYHKSCFKGQHPPRCDVCTNFIPKNSAGRIKYKEHPFWSQKYCPSHERDGTPRCCSCERREPRDMRYLLLDDGRKLCLECLDSAIMETHECQPLYLEIQDFYEGLYMKVEQQIPMLLVERQALNEAMEGEKNGHHHLPEARGLCLFEEQTVTPILRRPVIGAGYRIINMITETALQILRRPVIGAGYRIINMITETALQILRWPVIGAGYRIINMITEPYRLTRRCEVTAILVLYGLPRLLTGSILAHEMMHAWLRLKGYSNLSPEVEEGICQVLAHMWLKAEISVPAASDVASSSSSSSPSSSSFSASSKKGKQSDFEKKLGEFFIHQIESDTSSAYGDGFRIGNQAVVKYGLKRTLDHIRMTGSFPL